MAEAVKPVKYKDEEYKILSERQLKWRKFLKHKMAVVATVILILLYVIIIFADFFAPYGMNVEHPDYVYAPPFITKIKFIDHEGNFHIRPFMYRQIAERHPVTRRYVFTDDITQKDYIRFFISGDEYTMLGFIESDIHLFGVEEGDFFLFGTDASGRDLFSRIIFGGRVSLSIGIIGVIILVILGTIFGTISGYFGGATDLIIQRSIEIIRTLPQIALWMILAAAIPPRWPSLLVFVGIVIILGLIGWTGLARELRGKVLAIRNMDYVLASHVSGAGSVHIIFRHIIPNVISHIIVIGTLSIPIMIIAETSLSFLGLGVRPPMTSWGALLGRFREPHIIQHYPWLIIPAAFVSIAVICFNLAGDAIRDVIDPYSK